VSAYDDLLAKVRAVAFAPQADQFRDEACRHAVKQPYADNRYVRLLDEIRDLVRGADRSRPEGTGNPGVTGALPDEPVSQAGRPASGGGS